MIHEPFAVINADDYYGKEAFRKLHDWLILDYMIPHSIFMAGFILMSTLSDKEVPENPQKAEYLLLTLIGGLLRNGKCTVKVLEPRDNWFSVTYKDNK